MENDSHWAVEIRDVVDGLWVWRFENPFWKPGVDWEPLTTSTCVESGSEIPSITKAGLLSGSLLLNLSLGPL
jgi:hypothetical protein